MSLSMYLASVPAFLQILNNLSAILDKAEAYAGTHKIDPEVLLNYRLAPDMLPFVRQIQIAADLAKGAAARLAGVEVPKHDDTEKTFADLQARLAKAATFVEAICGIAVLNWGSVISLEPFDRECPRLWRRYTPTYQYRCRECGRSFERTETITEHEAV
jgi:hypothetical protein